MSEGAAGAGKNSSSTGDGLAELEGREVEVEGWLEDEGHLCGIGSPGQLCRPALFNTTPQLNFLAVRHRSLGSCISEDETKECKSQWFSEDTRFRGGFIGPHLLLSTRGGQSMQAVS